MSDYPINHGRILVDFCRCLMSPHINFDDLEEFEEDLPYETGTKPVARANDSERSVEDDAQSAEALQPSIAKSQVSGQSAGQTFTPAALPSINGHLTTRSVYKMRTESSR